MGSNSNINDAVKTYHGFLGLMKWGTIASLAAGALVVFLIA
ncbi:aa3-type cytochrome c oxidase subunit IV [Rhizorhapis sp.]|nr:aa3-type cytochrome c oxidase subunit IV [Rhizorhapis sp.]HKR18354.1 aa3-type cytochrome c oxidase subunit IV [Rhizorhapis sp.]HKX35371.1 aa3-type cytochrome c oxidase subunit IV [Rhizorhapis sp.]